MSTPVSVRLEPLGIILSVLPGTTLADLLHQHGVEFPCGGRGICRGCRVRVIAGQLDEKEHGPGVLDPVDWKNGWRLACRCEVAGPVTLEIGQWNTIILTDHQPFDYTPSDGLGIVVDVGTTTLVAQLLDLRNARTLAVATALNPQAAFGSDLMSRVEFAQSKKGRIKLKEIIRAQVADLIADLLGRSGADAGSVLRAVLVGNTVMHHLFFGIDTAPLAAAPFEPDHDGPETMPATKLATGLPKVCRVRFVPFVGGFVGSDLLAGVLAVDLHESQALRILVDLGTNGEIVAGNRDRILCASTAAGPAFEGGRIAMGMWADTGAIAKVSATESGFACRVLGNVKARGICGSGLVDAAAAALQSGALLPSGKMVDGKRIELIDGVYLSQQDVRELQLAKAAIAAGVQILLDRLGATPNDVATVYLAGAFGNTIDPISARRIGLFDASLKVVEPVGNTALLGAKRMLFEPDSGARIAHRILDLTEHVSLAADPEFIDQYVSRMGFPD